MPVRKPAPRKLWRVAVVCLVHRQERVVLREYRAPCTSAVMQMALTLKGAVRIQSIEEIGGAE